MMTCEPGETKSVKFGRLTHIREGLITADADIECIIHDADHDPIGSPIVGVADGTSELSFMPRQILDGAAL